MKPNDNWYSHDKCCPTCGKDTSYKGGGYCDKYQDYWDDVRKEERRGEG